MSRPLVSIIVPTYNVEKYIEDCMVSILNQSYSNIEIIIIDDGSTDTTPDFLKQFDKKVHLTLNPINQGQGAVRNQGIKKASGKYILFVDADDWMDYGTVERLVDKAIQTNADLIRFNGQSFSDSGALPETTGQYDFSKVLNESQVYTGKDILYKNQKSYSASPCLYMVKKKLLMKNHILFPEGILHEDEYFTTKVFLSTKVMAFVDKEFYHRRYRDASTMTESSQEHKERSFLSYLEIFKLLEIEYNSRIYNSSQKSFLKRQLLSIYNGLQQSKVDKNFKSKLKQLDAITIKDKIYLLLSKFKNKF